MVKVLLLRCKGLAAGSESEPGMIAAPALGVAPGRVREQDDRTVSQVPTST